MRPIYLCDLDAAARALLAVPPEDRAVLARHIVFAADTADRYRKRLRKAHTAYGTGTLTSAVSDMTRAGTPYCHADYRKCLQTLLSALTHQSA
ncbi:hypothetical protein SAMN04488515_0798 [Cognatiyoonia koreensis]|uniref:DUF7742 domain-containing protein n=1 Tax=Cognatiyoonia koreensis TaxID=364200 RepID=A0A1I0NSP8_9RHOB|nr:hypothetical protein [Cognatiyoonia koreensis]SEW04583.1 hypothetical protein SAMN04488515_0798 [Cognatiyoonia koreensis]